MNFLTALNKFWQNSNIRTYYLKQALLQASVSHDTSVIIVICWLDAQETFIFINFENSWVLINIFVAFICM